jgi:hypothetical protein
MLRDPEVRMRTLNQQLWSFSDHGLEGFLIRPWSISDHGREVLLIMAVKYFWSWTWSIFDHGREVFLAMADYYSTTDEWRRPWPCRNAAPPPPLLLLLQNPCWINRREEYRNPTTCCLDPSSGIFWPEKANISGVLIPLQNIYTGGPVRR